MKTSFKNHWTVCMVTFRRHTVYDLVWNFQRNHFKEVVPPLPGNTQLWGPESWVLPKALPRKADNLEGSYYAYWSEAWYYMIMKCFDWSSKNLSIYAEDNLHIYWPQAIGPNVCPGMCQTTSHIQLLCYWMTFIYRKNLCIIRKCIILSEV